MFIEIGAGLPSMLKLFIKLLVKQNQMITSLQLVKPLSSIILLQKYLIIISLKKLII